MDIESASIDSSSAPKAPEVEKHIECSFALFNKTTQRWEAPSLDSHQQSQIEATLQAYATYQTGTHIEVTSKGVFIKNGDGWVKVDDKPGLNVSRVAREVRQATQKTGSTNDLEISSDFLSTVATKSAGLFQKVIGWFRKKDVVVEVRVVENEKVDHLEKLAARTREENAPLTLNMQPPPSLTLPSLETPPPVESSHVEQAEPLPPPPPQTLAAQFAENFETTKAQYLHVLDALEAFRDPSFRQACLDKKLSEQEVTNLFSHLSDAAKSLNQFTTGLGYVNDFFHDGKIEEGMDCYAKLMNGEYPKYIDAMKVAALKQQVIEERSSFLPQDAQKCFIDLGHPQFHAILFRSSMDQAVKELGLEHAHENWKASCGSVVEGIVAFRRARSLPLMRKQIEQASYALSELKTTLGLIDIAETRESLVASLKKSGLNDTEIDNLISFFREANATLSQFEERLQEVKKLASEGNVGGKAMAQYLEMMSTDFVKYVAVAKKAYQIHCFLEKRDTKVNRLGRMSHPITQGFARFFSSQGVSSPPNVRQCVEKLWKDVENQQRIFDEVVASGHPASDAQYHDWEFARSLAKKGVDSLQEANSDFQALTSSASFFSDHLLRGPAAQDPQFLTFIQQNGWSAQDMHDFGHLMARYDAEVEPLFVAQGAESYEKLQQLKKKRLPYVDKLNRSYLKQWQPRIKKLDDALDAYRTHLKAELRKIEKAREAMRISTREQLAKSPYSEDLKRQYARALDIDGEESVLLHQRLAAVEGVSCENMMWQKGQFLNSLFKTFE